MTGGKIRIRLEAYDHQALDASSREIWGIGGVAQENVYAVIVSTVGPEFALHIRSPSFAPGKQWERRRGTRSVIPSNS